MTITKKCGRKTGKMKPNKRLLLILFAGLIAMVVAWQFVSNSFREEEKAVRKAFREMVQEAFPEQSAQVSGSFGIRPFEVPKGAP